MWHRWTALGLVPAVAVVAMTVPSKEAGPRANGAILDERLHQGATIEQYVAQLVGLLRTADRSGDGLERDDVDLASARAMAMRRADQISQVLQSDLNADFKVTRAEIERVTLGDEPMRSRQVEIQLSRYDANNDGVITLQEAAAKRGDRAIPFDDQGKALLALDPDADGRLMPDELRVVAERHFATVDKDGDGKISAAEFAPIAERQRAAMMERSLPVCTLPPVPSGARLIVYGGYEGDAISSAVIGGQDQETNFIDVKVEPGKVPLYIIFTSYESMVWRLSGDTRRVVQLVVASEKGNAAGHSLSGVIGLPREKVTIASPGCPNYYYKTENRQATMALASIRKAVGRDPDEIFGSYSASSVSLPSGTVIRAIGAKAPAPQGFDPDSWREAVRFWPAGLMPVNARSVIASARVEPYQVFPSQMGLAQLIGQGAITKTGSGRYRIVRPIAHLPPGMGGSHSVHFDLPTGIPMPPGDPVHSCIRSEVSGQPISKSILCRR